MEISINAILQAVADQEISVEEAAKGIARLVPSNSRFPAGGWPVSFYDSIEPSDDDEPSNFDVAELGEAAARKFGEVTEKLGSAVSGAARLLFGDAQQPQEQGEPAQQPSGPTSDRRALRVRVSAVGREVNIVADDSVETIMVRGPHKTRSHGDVLEVVSEGDIAPSLSNLKITVLRRDGIRSGKQLEVRINPGLLLDVELTSGRLSVEGVPRLGKVRLTAGSGQISGVKNVEDALFQASGCHLAGSFEEGNSSVKIESGSVTLDLTNADVTVTATSQLAKISWPGGAKIDEYVAGDGRGRLALSVIMGKASVKS